MEKEPSFKSNKSNVQEHQYHPFSWTPTEGEIEQQARLELGETPEKVRYGLAAMKRNISMKGLPAYEDDAYLLTFLRVKKFSHSNSFKMLEGFTKSLKAFHDRIGPAHPGPLQEALSKCTGGILQYRDPTGRPTIFYRFGIHMKEGIPVEESMRFSQLILFHLILQPLSQTVGINWIVDCKRISLREAYDSISYGIMFCRFLAMLPLRIHRVDIINESPIFQFCFKALTPFIPGEILTKIRFHGKNMEPLIEHYGSFVLPDEFGGTGGVVSNEHWMDQIQEACEILTKLQLKAAS